MKSIILAALAALGIVCSSFAYAQDAGVAVADASVAVVSAPISLPTLGPGIAPLPSPENPITTISALTHYFGRGDYLLGGVVAVFLLVWIARRPFVSDYVPFFRTDRGGAVLAGALGLSVAVAVMFRSGQPLSWATFVAGLAYAWGAVGGRQWVNRLVKPKV